MQALSHQVRELNAGSAESLERVQSHGAAIGVLQQGLATLKEDVLQERQVNRSSLLFALQVHMTPELRCKATWTYCTQESCDCMQSQLHRCQQAHSG